VTRREAILVAGLLGLGVNSVYLGARADANPFYFANVGLHVVLGLAVASVLAVLARRHWSALPALARAAATVLGAGLLLGVVLLVTGTTRPVRPLLHVHIGLVGLGTLLMLVSLRRRSWLAVPRGARPWVAGAALLLLAAPAVRWAADLAPPEQRIVNPPLPPLTMDGEGQGPEGPFFPTSAETNVGGTIPSTFFMTAAECGRCHPDIYKQWSSSAHHFSSFNNQWYRKAIEYMQDVIGPRPSKWCAGCHDHAVLFNGQFETPIRGRDKTPEAQAGLTCTSCHSIVHVKSTMGQGDFTIEYPPLHDLAVSDQPVLRAAHDYLLRLDPGPHSRTFLKSFHTEQTPEFCVVCHKVHLDVPVNGYRWFRGFNEYDNWQASGVSGQGARSFYYPPEPQNCPDCHMPLVPADDPAARDGQVHSHRFPAANTALPFVNRDEEQLEVVQAFLRDAVTVDVFGIVRGEEGALQERAIAGGGPTLSSTFAAGEETMNFGASRAVLRAPAEVVGPLGAADVALRRGESARVEVVVRTRKVGHFFPGGTVDAFEVWVELKAVDSNGRTLLHSGYVEDDGRGPVDPGAHFYRSLMLDERGNPITKRNAWATRSVAYVRLIPPGAADTVHFRLQVPEDCGDRIFLEARLNYRKFAWWNTQWAFAGVRDPEDTDYSLGPGHDDGRWVFTGDTSDVAGKIKAIPDIPITVISTNRAEIPVLPADAPEPADEPFLDASVRERWNDYGIGLLLQGDLRGAEAAFLKVTEMDPGYADGWVNVGRARVREGRMDEAAEVLRRALEVNPDLASAHFFLALALKTFGDYDEALGHLRRAAAQYPRDRVVRNQIGRVLFLKRQYADAIGELERVLAVDPEDLQAHYTLMLASQGVGDAAKARTHEALYRRFKADESAQTITGPYRRLHPYDNNERQAIHEHGVSLEPAEPPRYSAAALGERPVATVTAPAPRARPRVSAAERADEPTAGRGGTR
jgi:tetratricopeptide (TPR) repeat protein